jgi:hypothetical protein
MDPTRVNVFGWWARSEDPDAFRASDDPDEEPVERMSGSSWNFSGDPRGLMVTR